MADSEGNEIWSQSTKTYFSSLFCRGVANLPDKNYALVAYSNIFENGVYPSFTLKFAYDGTYIFFSFFSGNSIKVISEIIVENDGGFVAVGKATSFYTEYVFVKGGFFRCTPGYYFENANCTQCPAGTYNPYYGLNDSSTCFKCSAGTYSTIGSANCISCPAGTYNPNCGGTSLSSCIDCSAGTYSSINSTNCTSCPAGTYNPYFRGTSLSSCIACSAGTYSSIGFANCKSCPAGTYNPNYGGTSLSSCIDCSAGTYSTLRSSNCIFCPADTYNSNTRSTSISACLPCPSNTTASQGSVSCSACNCGDEYVCKRNGCWLKNLGLQNCTSLEDCADNNSTRAACDSTCKCNTGYFWSNSKGLCVPPMNGTYLCNNNFDCTHLADNVQCKGFCICTSPYSWSKSRIRCLKENVNKFSCTSIDNCMDNGNFAICDEKCSCIKGYVYNNEEEKCIKLPDIIDEEINKDVYKEIYTLVIIFVVLMVLNVLAIIKDESEFVVNTGIDDSANQGNQGNCQIDEQKTPRMDNDSTRNEFFRKDEKKQEELKNDQIILNIEEDPLLFWGKIGLCKLFIITYLRSHELIKIFTFFSPTLSRKSRAIIFCLQVQTASSFLIFLNIVLCLNASIVWQIITPLYIALPIKWVIEYLLRFTCDTSISALLASSRTEEEIRNFITRRLKLQSKIRKIGQYTGYCLICIFFISAIYLLTAFSIKFQNTLYFYILFMILYYLVIHQCLVVFFQFILIIICGPSYTKKDLSHPSCMKSFIMREVVEHFSS